MYFMTLTDAKFARMDMMKSGIVLKKQTRHKKIQPVDFLRAISLAVAFKFFHTCENLDVNLKINTHDGGDMLTMSFGFGARVIVAPLTRLLRSKFATI